jgi:hypothetical protein
MLLSAFRGEVGELSPSWSAHSPCVFDPFIAPFYDPYCIVVAFIGACALRVLGLCPFSPVPIAREQFPCWVPFRGCDLVDVIAAGIGHAVCLGWNDNDVTAVRLALYSSSHYVCV